MLIRFPHALERVAFLVAAALLCLCAAPLQAQTLPAVLTPAPADNAPSATATKQISATPASKAQELPAAAQTLGATPPSVDAPRQTMQEGPHPATNTDAMAAPAVDSAAPTSLPTGTKTRRGHKKQDHANADGEAAPSPQNNAEQSPSLMPAPPPPLEASKLENAVQTEAERAYYDAKRKRYMNTYEKAYEGLVPLGPDEVRETMGRYERTQRAAVPPSAGQPRGQVRIKTLALEPGSEPPTVNISAGYITTITVVDATGEPWPIMDLGVGGNFEVSKTGAGNHVVRITPLTRYGYGNLSVLLQDLTTPIIFKLASGGATVDYRFDARIPRLGPNAKIGLIEQRNKGLEAGSAVIMTFLDNAPPAEAKRLRVSGTDQRTLAWQMNDRMFIRTPLTMISPSWDASVASADGTTVYEMGETPIFLMSDNGVLVRARVAQKDQE